MSCFPVPELALGAGEMNFWTSSLLHDAVNEHASGQGMLPHPKPINPASVAQTEAKPGYLTRSTKRVKEFFVFLCTELARFKEAEFSRYLCYTVAMKKKTIRKASMHSFTVVFESAPEGGYIVHVPSLPGCSTQGKTFEDAQKNAKEAIEGYLAVMNDLKEEISLESDATIVSRIPAFVR